MNREEMLQVAKPVLFNTDMVRAILDGRKTETRRCLKGYARQNLEVDVDGTVIGVHDRFEGRVRPVTDYARYKPGDYLYVRETWMVQAAKRYESLVRVGYRAGGQMTTIQFPNGCTDSINRIGYDAFVSKWSLDRWYPSIHMPKEAARIFLQVTDVRLERLQDITEEQAVHEGICRLYDHLSDDEYNVWAKRKHINAQKSEWNWKNYLWHGHFGKHGTGNAISDKWEYQYSSYDNPIDSFSSLWNSTVPLYLWSEYGWDASPWVWVVQFKRG